MKVFKYNRLLLMGLCAALVFMAAIFLVPQQSEAKVMGQCGNCHTMHNSQGGVDMVQQFSAFEYDASKGGDCAGCHNTPRENLLTLSCIGCHAMSASAMEPALQMFDGYPVPQVMYDSNEDMAAGNFYYVRSGIGYGDNYGHNVHGFRQTYGIAPDLALNPTFNAPPGYVSTMDYGSPDFFPSPAPNQVMCAGAYGCHGNRTVISQTQATAGAHHANDSMLKFGATFTLTTQGSTTGTSYRFLSGVQGGEHPTWENNLSGQQASHNIYKGEDIGSRTAGPAQAAGDINTMSEFCAGCHGNFHMTGGAPGTGLGQPSPWIRHPTDVAIPNVAPYNVYTTYRISAPVAFSSIPDGTSPDEHTQIEDGTDNAIVFCLSCHRAHASSEPDSLRFSYANILTGNGGGVAGVGCFACHNDK